MPTSTMSASSRFSGRCAVVMQHGEVERLDAPEIVGVEHMLAADRRRRRRAEIGFEHLQDRLQRRHAGDVEPLAGLLELLGQLAVDQGVEHDAGRRLDLLQHPVELAPAAHERVEVLDRPHLRVLHRGRPWRSPPASRRSRPRSYAGGKCGGSSMAMPWITAMDRWSNWASLAARSPPAVNSAQDFFTDSLSRENDARASRRTIPLPSPRQIARLSTALSASSPQPPRSARLDVRRFLRAMLR